MNVLITGISGFIGGALARRMSADGNCIWGLSRTYKDTCGIPQERFLKKDLLDRNLQNLIPKDLDLIIHCAGIAAPNQALNNPEEAMMVNAIGTERMLFLARLLKIPIVFASSVYIYDGCDEFPWREDMEVRPRSPLGASKLAAEAIARAYWECFTVASVAMRFFTVYGPGANKAQFIPSAIKKIREAKNVVKFGSPKSTRDFIFIDDVLDGIISVTDFLFKNKGFHIFNFGSGIETSIENVCKNMVKIFGAPGLKIAFNKLPSRPDESGGYSRHWSSISKAEKLLGWHPKNSLEEGLKKTFNAMVYE